MRLGALLITLAVVLAGCAGAPVAPDTTTSPGPATAAPGDGTTGDGTTGDGTSGDGSTTDGEEPTTPARTPRPDPDEDRLGWEDDYWHDDPLSVDAGDGLNRTEIDRVVARTMARVEVIRELEFEESVDVEVISREQYRERNVFEFDDDPWRDQVWEAAFLVDEETDSGAAFGGIYSGQVAGYYRAGSIVLVSDDTDSVRIDRSTLAHELVHALQAQHLGFGRGDSHDARQAALGLTEGDANYVMDRYEQRCETEWDCIEPVQPGNSTGPVNRGLFLSVFVPYSDGPTLVADLRERGGWEAVNDAMERHPASTEQVIHPDRYPDEEPVDVVVPDRSSDDWQRFGGRRGETLGEATLYATFQTNGVIPGDHLTSDETRYNYSHPATEGWGGDSVVPYRSRTDDGDEYGYVFRTVWDSDRDAREFREAYLELLAENGATRVREGVYRIPEGEPYADAFRVERRGDAVVVVNAPTVDDLADVHPSP